MSEKLVGEIKDKEDQREIDPKELRRRAIASLPKDERLDEMAIGMMEVRIRARNFYPGIVGVPSCARSFCM